MKHLGTLSVLTAALTVFPCVAQAQLAYTAIDVHLRAGPARDYPSIAVLPAGFEILVQGCLGDYTWCDVIAGPNRGWIYAGNLSTPYENTYVPVLDYGAVIGIAVVGFILGDYWFDHYRDRPWYPERQRWIHRYAPPPYGYRVPPPGPGLVGPGRTHRPPPPMGGPGGFRPPPSVGFSPGAPRPPQAPGPGPGGFRPPPAEGHSRFWQHLPSSPGPMPAPRPAPGQGVRGGSGGFHGPGGHSHGGR